MRSQDSSGASHLFFFMSEFSAFANSGKAGMEKARAALVALVATSLHVSAADLKVVDYPRTDFPTTSLLLREFGSAYRLSKLNGCYFVWAEPEDVKPLMSQLNAIEMALTELVPLHRVILVREDGWTKLLKAFDQHGLARSFLVEGRAGLKPTYVMPHKAEYEETDAVFLEVFMRPPLPRSTREDEPTMEIVLDDPNKTLPQ